MPCDGRHHGLALLAKRAHHDVPHGLLLEQTDDVARLVDEVQHVALHAVQGARRRHLLPQLRCRDDGLGHDADAERAGQGPADEGVEASPERLQRPHSRRLPPDGHENGLVQLAPLHVQGGWRQVLHAKRGPPRRQQVQQLLAARPRRGRQARLRGSGRASGRAGGRGGGGPERGGALSQQLLDHPRDGDGKAEAGRRRIVREDRVRKVVRRPAGPGRARPPGPEHRVDVLAARHDCVRCQPGVPHRPNVPTLPVGLAHDRHVRRG
mmetsp:Transcript_2542/g.10073  ORF Transcript_2542/g.10073 Transcript_2542/m.10073 type:complete len:266 (-) Transcript_2542:602-1399(-)